MLMVMKIIKNKDGYRLVRKEDGYTTEPYHHVSDALLSCHYNYNELDVKNLHRYFRMGMSQQVFDELFRSCAIRDE